MAESAIDCARIGQHALAGQGGRCFIFVSIFMALLSLSGCAHYFNLTADDFHRGDMSNIQFQRDNNRCQTAATVRQNQVGGGDPHGIYNRAYVACMAKRGYVTNNIDLLDIGG